MRATAKPVARSLWLLPSGLYAYKFHEHKDSFQTRLLTHVTPGKMLGCVWSWFIYAMYLRHKISKISIFTYSSASGLLQHECPPHLCWTILNIEESLSQWFLSVIHTAISASLVTCSKTKIFFIVNCSNFFLLSWLPETLLEMPLYTFSKCIMITYIAFLIYHYLWSFGHIPNLFT